MARKEQLPVGAGLTALVLAFARVLALRVGFALAMSLLRVPAELVTGIEVLMALRATILVAPFGLL